MIFFKNKMDVSCLNIYDTYPKVHKLKRCRYCYSYKPTHYRCYRCWSAVCRDHRYVIKDGMSIWQQLVSDEKIGRLCLKEYLNDKENVAKAIKTLEGGMYATDWIYSVIGNKNVCEKCIERAQRKIEPPKPKPNLIELRKIALEMNADEMIKESIYNSKPCKFAERGIRLYELATFYEKGASAETLLNNRLYIAKEMNQPQYNEYDKKFIVSKLLHDHIIFPQMASQYFVDFFKTNDKYIVLEEDRKRWNELIKDIDNI